MKAILNKRGITYLEAALLLPVVLLLFLSLLFVTNRAQSGIDLTNLIDRETRDLSVDAFTVAPSGALILNSAKLRATIDELQNKINSGLLQMYTADEYRLQLYHAQVNINPSSGEFLSVSQVSSASSAGTLSLGYGFDVQGVVERHIVSGSNGGITPVAMSGASDTGENFYSQGVVLFMKLVVEPKDRGYAGFVIDIPRTNIEKIIPVRAHVGCCGG